MSEETDTKRNELRAQLAALAGNAKLTAEPLQRKPEFQGKSTEILAVAQDNQLMQKHPEMTQFLGPDEQASLEALGQALPGIAQPSSAPIAAPPVTVPIAAVAPSRSPAPNRILLTGRSGVGKSFLAAQVSGARVAELTDPIDQFLRENFPDLKWSPEFDALAATIKAWGDGVITDKYPLSIARLLFIRHVEPVWNGFGQPGYWVNRLIQNHNEPGQSIVTRVEGSADFKALVAAGFKHYHVIASTSTFNTRIKRKGADDRLAATCDADVIQKLSRQRQGPRLNVIWNDPASQPPSQRVFTVSQWLQEVAADSFPQTGE